MGFAEEMLQVEDSQGTLLSTREQQQPLPPSYCYREEQRISSLEWRHDAGLQPGEFSSVVGYSENLPTHGPHFMLNLPIIMMDMIITT